MRPHDHQREEDADIADDGVAQREGGDRRDEDGDEGAERGEACGEGGGEPGDAGDQPGRPVQRQHGAEEGGDALAALEAETDGKDVPDKGAERGERHQDFAAPERRGAEPGEEDAAGDKGRDGAFAGVEEEREEGELLVAGAQDVGRADIARADVADVAEARPAGEDLAEGNGAEGIAEHEGSGEIRHGRAPTGGGQGLDDHSWVSCARRPAT